MHDRNHNSYVWWILLAAAAVGLAAALGQMTWKAREARMEADREAARQAEEAERRARLELDRNFGQPISPTPDDLAALGPFFASLAAALQTDKPAVVAAHFDIERMANELAHRGFFARFGPEDEERARATFVGGTERIGRLVGDDELYRWHHTAIRRVRWNADRSAALVVAIHRLDGRAEPLRMRWWLVSTPNGWKAYDFENIVGGVGLIATLEAASDVQELNRFAEQAHQVRGAAAAALAGYPDTADQLLAPVRRPKLPEALTASRTLAEAFIRLHRGDPAGALAFLEEAAKRNPDLPLSNLGRAIACARTGDCQAAIAAAAAVATDLGDDLGVHFWHGFALEEQGKFFDAIGFYQQALDADPNSLLALNGLRRTSGFSPELVKRMGQTRNRTTAYAFLKRASTLDGIEFIVSPWPDPQELAGFALFREAARAQRVEEQYRLKQTLPAYKDIGPDHKTFDQLAGCLVRDKDAAGLTKLLAAHGKLFPNDPWLEFRQAELHALQGEVPEAVASYRGFSRNPAASPADHYSAYALVVRTWLRAGDAQKAREAMFATGPEWLPIGLRGAVLALAGDVAGLERLLAARVKAPGGLTPFYADEDYSRLIADEKFAELRKKYPR